MFSAPSTQTPAVNVPPLLSETIQNHRQSYSFVYSEHSNLQLCYMSCQSPPTYYPKGGQLSRKNYVLNTFQTKEVEHMFAEWYLILPEKST
jgi:hypothetical protein